MFVSEERIYLFKPTLSIEPPTLKYDGWFSCGSHCACTDCEECVIRLTESEAESSSGAHFYEYSA